ncbi:serine hydrolase domain-containing protein [Liquorilactobacillus uvarum]|uniref:serine hydrolase domain-containing protein n=1 Tax=Liquorilactobacillus uvarum TaxID=303240 RepID=UPI00288B061D|nr:serine hydrolase [Liquorilactobacillus uvarum]
MKKRYIWIIILILLAVSSGLLLKHKLDAQKQMIESSTDHKVRVITVPKVGGATKDKDQFGLNVRDEHDKSIIDYTENRIKKDGFIGTILIVKNGKAIFQKGYGYADKINNKKNSAGSLFQIASVQKAATGVMLMKLVQSGRVSLCDKLSKYYPSIGYSSEVTLREMLNMISGVSLKEMPGKVMSQDQLVNYVVKNVEVNPKHIGNQYYQPANFVLLAGIIKKVTGRSYYSEFKQMIQDPLKLENTCFFDKYYDSINGRTVAYNSGNMSDYKVLANEQKYQYTNELGTGNLYMTNGDLYKMLRSFITGGTLNTKNTSELFTVFPPYNTYSSGLYHLKYLQQFKKLGINNGYHFHGAEYGYETIGDISADGKQAVILQTNNPNSRKPFNMVIDSDLYHFSLTH